MKNKETNHSTNLFLLKPGECHLGFGDELLGVLKVHIQVLFSPNHASILVGGGVRIAWDTTALSTNHTIQIRAGLVGTTLYFFVKERTFARRNQIEMQPTLLIVWHWVHRALKSFSPFAGSPTGMLIVAEETKRKCHLSLFVFTRNSTPSWIL